MLAAVDDYTPQACGCFVHGYYVNNGYHGLIGSRLINEPGYFSDYHEGDGTAPFMSIGYPYYAGNSCGVFSFEDESGTSWHDVGSRLSKN